MVPSDWNMPDSFDGFCSLWPGADPVNRMRVCIRLLDIFKIVLDVYNFFIISNRFDSNKPYALSTHNLKSANKTQNIWRSTEN